MAKDNTRGCVSVAKGPIVPDAGEPKHGTGTGQTERKEGMMRAAVGKEAPDFEATAFHEGKFDNIKLSDYRGKWVLLCFYPGDYTFV